MVNGCIKKKRNFEFTSDKYNINSCLAVCFLITLCLEWKNNSDMQGIMSLILFLSISLICRASGSASRGGEKVGGEETVTDRGVGQSRETTGRGI